MANLTANEAIALLSRDTSFKVILADAADGGHACMPDLEQPPVRRTDKVVFTNIRACLTMFHIRCAVKLSDRAILPYRAILAQGTVILYAVR